MLQIINNLNDICWEYTVKNSGGYSTNSRYEFIPNINESGLISYSIFELEFIVNFIKKLE